MSEVSRNELFAERILQIPQGASVGALRVLLAIDEASARTRLGQVLFVTAANVVSRLFTYCPTLHVAAPDLPLSPGLPLLRADLALGPAVVDMFQRLAPDGVVGSYAQHSEGEYDLALIVGNAQVKAGVRLYLGCDGWRAYAGTQPCAVTPSGDNPFGALLAGGWGAALVAAELFRPLGPDPGRYPAAPAGTWLSAYDYHVGEGGANPPLPPLVLGDVPLIGLGALGAAAAYTLALLPRVHGTILGLDHDTLSTTNMERHFVSERQDIGKGKAAHMKEVVERLNPSLRFDGFATTFEAWERRHDPFEVILCGPDNRDVRRAVQFSLPYMAINAGTTGADFLVSRHRFDDGACLACLYADVGTVIDAAGEVSRQFGVNRATAEALLNGTQAFDEDVAATMRARGTAVLPDSRLAALLGRPFHEVQRTVCSEATVREDLPVPTIGFVSFIPGVLMVAELVKASAFPASLPAGTVNVVRADAFDLPKWRVQRLRKTPSCACQDPVYQEAYATRWPKVDVEFAG